MTGAIFMLRCAEMGLSDDDLKGMTIGMVLDMYTEKANDMEDYPIKGTSQDYARFFG